MEKKSRKLQKKLIWNHIVIGTMNKDDEVLTKASKDFDDLLDKARKETLREVKDGIDLIKQSGKWNLQHKWLQEYVKTVDRLLSKLKDK